MSHQRQEVCSRHSGRTSTDDRYFFACRYVCLRNGYLICCNLIYRVFFDTTDIDRIIDQISTATLLTWMLTDHGTCSWQRVVATDQIDCICVISLMNVCNVTRNINMCRTECHTWDLLTYIGRTFPFLYMALIFVCECFKSFQNLDSGLITDGTVCSITDHDGNLSHLVHHFHSADAIQNFA